MVNMTQQRLCVFQIEWWREQSEQLFYEPDKKISFVDELEVL